MEDIKKKQEAYNFGILAEQLAADEYIKRGYTILERRMKQGKSEIDLVAQKDDVIVLIEVKARSGKNEEALSTVTRDKRKRMVRVADSYLQRLKGDYQYRFDIVTVTGTQDNNHIDIYEDAFVAADLF